MRSGCGLTRGNCYFDGAVQAYDAINQVIPTTVGDTYVTGTGGNGRDMFVYAGTGIPVRAPEPMSLAILGTGLAGLGLCRRHRKG